MLPVKESRLKGRIRYGTREGRSVDILRMVILEGIWKVGTGAGKES